MSDNLRQAKVFKAFGDGNRLKILELLKGGEKCACRLLEALKIGQPTLSHHMKILVDTGIVNDRREGKWTYYTINPNGIERARELLRKMLE